MKKLIIALAIAATLASCKSPEKSASRYHNYTGPFAVHNTLKPTV
jgi:ABC-type uncharacterized transport system auxiliary subunit